MKDNAKRQLALTGAAVVALTTAAAGVGTASAAPAATKYWYNTWKQAPTYPRLGDDRIGWLFPGDNYFYCEFYDEWDDYHGNHWYAKTDDDQGNRNVFVPEYFFTAATSPVGMKKC